MDNDEAIGNLNDEIDAAITNGKENGLSPGEIAAELESHIDGLRAEMDGE